MEGIANQMASVDLTQGGQESDVFYLLFFSTLQQKMCQKIGHMINAYVRTSNLRLPIELLLHIFSYLRYTPWVEGWTKEIFLGDIILPMYDSSLWAISNEEHVIQPLTPTEYEERYGREDMQCELCYKISWYWAQNGINNTFMYCDDDRRVSFARVCSIECQNFGDYLHR